jgi:hypothetical protein
VHCRRPSHSSSLGIVSSWPGMSEKPLYVLATNITAACSRFQAMLSDDSPADAAVTSMSAQHPSVVALTQLLREHEELLGRLSNNEQGCQGGEEHVEIANVARKRERVLMQGLDALETVAVSMRAVLDDVEELVPADNGYLPNVQVRYSFNKLIAAL